MSAHDESHGTQPSSTAETESRDCLGPAVANEETRLLDTDLPPHVVPSRSFQNVVVSMCVLFLFIVEASQFIMGPPLQQVAEDRICGEFYPDHELGLVTQDDGRCKDKAVQKELAMLRSWQISGEMFVRECKASAPFWKLSSRLVPSGEPHLNRGRA